MRKLFLPEVTLISLCSRDYDENQRALDYSSQEIEFGDVKLIRRPDIKNINDWNKAIVYDLGDYVFTEYAILIHNNGFIVNPEMWRDEWLQYDFAGSPFPLPSELDNVSYRDVYGNIQRVGNSVGLRSKKLLDLPKKLNLEWKPFHGFYNEDGAISVNYRHIFEANGCEYMPFEEAVYFGREKELPENQHIDKPFLFHNYEGRNAIYKDMGK